MNNIINTETFTTTYPGGEITRYQIISLKTLSGSETFKGKADGSVLDALTVLCRAHLLPKMPTIDSLVLFILPNGFSLPFPEKLDDETITDPASRARFWLNRYVDEGQIEISENGFTGSNPEVMSFLSSLEEKNLLRLINVKPGGNLYFIPVSPKMDFPSRHYTPETITINTHFFLMDLTDLETKYDIMGEPHGLLMIRGKIINPPIYPRSALFIDKNGKNEITQLKIEDIGVEVNGTIHRHGSNSIFYRRPEFSLTPREKGLDIAIVGRRIAGYKIDGGLEVPEAGFVLHITETKNPENLNVTYHLDKGDFFGIQVGPLLIQKGNRLFEFKNKYYNGEGIRFPPTVYPQGWTIGKAARLGLGIRKGTPVLIWIEGSKPATYRPFIDSMGFTLDEFAQLASDLGIDNFINLDGGGSTQIALGLTKRLRIADCKIETGEEFERPVPMGLSIKL